MVEVLLLKEMIHGNNMHIFTLYGEIFIGSKMFNNNNNEKCQASLLA